MITICLLRSRIWFHAMFLILISEIVFFANFACDKSRWFSPSLPSKKKMFAGGKLSCLKQIVKFLRVLLKTNQNNCTFLRLLLAINRNNLWQKNIKATFASGKWRWLKKNEYIFTTFVSDKFRWLQLFAGDKPRWLQLFATFGSDKSRWMHLFATFANNKLR